MILDSGPEHIDVLRAIDQRAHADYEIRKFFTDGELKNIREFLRNDLSSGTSLKVRTTKGPTPSVSGLDRVSCRVRPGTNAIDQLQEFRVETKFREAVPVLVLAHRDQRIGLRAEQLAVNPEGTARAFHQPLHRLEVF
jgi:hypothetical protein